MRVACDMSDVAAIPVPFAAARAVSLSSTESPEADAPAAPGVLARTGPVMSVHGPEEAHTAPTAEMLTRISSAGNPRV
jgi:hypothetical protein